MTIRDTFVETVANGDQLDDGYFNECYEAIKNTTSGHFHNGTDSRSIAKESYVVILPQAYSAVIAGTWARAQSDADFLGEMFHNNDGSPSDGDEINFKVALQQGTYTLFLVTRQNADTPIIDVDLGGTQIASFDTYAAGLDEDHFFSQASIAIATDGLQTLRVYADGKNASSNNYVMDLQAIIFVRTA